MAPYRNEGRAEYHKSPLLYYVERLVFFLYPQSAPHGTMIISALLT